MSHYMIAKLRNMQDQIAELQAQCDEWRERAERAERASNHSTPMAMDVTVEPMTPEGEARFAEMHDNRYTPGCDCGHDGLGPAWHVGDCVWNLGWS